MENGHWEIGFNAESLENLLSGEGAGMSLWFLAGYLKGLSDGDQIQSGKAQITLEPDGEGSWRLKSRASQPEQGRGPLL